ncbi:MAG: beta-lactamase family protein [Bryobacteraceae bacterium]|nr:beta-lactamase family protein [Bryobacteraceae bacterium]
MRIALITLCLAAVLRAQPLPVSTPEKEGLSSERLQRLHARFDDFVKQGKRAGAITLVMRNGKVVDWKTFGYRDLEAKLPMEKDTICRIWSMTKVVTSVAVMMLVEEGRITLSDPVSKFIPELKDMQVLTGGLADHPDTVAAVRPITVEHLLTHTSGLTYSWGNDTVSELNRRAKIFDVSNLKEFVGKIAKIPLTAQPGEKFNYGINIDVLGYLVEVVSGIPFDRFVQDRIAGPLKMKDTHFVLPSEKLPRLAKTYQLKDGKLVETTLEGARPVGTVPFGGMGLYSTIGDYARFGQMLLNFGELNGVRLLGRKTVELMTANHLNDLKTPSIDASGAYGFGLGGSVHLDIAKGRIPGSVGDFGWDGAASTYFRMDPKERLVALLFQQYMPFDKPSLELFSTLVNQAID